MTDYNDGGQETSGCIGLKTTVCPNGVINVKRPQSDSAHSVFVDGDGDVIRCSCKGHKYNGHCVHQDEIEKRPLVVSSAVAAAADTSQQVATDGGQPVETTEDTNDDYEQISKHRGRCVECGREGPLDLDGTPVVLHTDGCEQADDNDDNSAESDDADEPEATGTGFQTATGWGTSDRRVPDDEDEEIDDTPL